MVVVKPVFAALQLAPPFVLLNTPFRYVPAYRVVGAAGSTIKAETISPSDPQLAHTAPPSGTVFVVGMKVGAFSDGRGKGAVGGVFAVGSLDGAAILAGMAVGKKACVSAAIAICVATSPAICFPRGVTVGRGVPVGAGMVVAAEVQLVNIARMLIAASTRRIVSFSDVRGSVISIHPNRAKSSRSAFGRE
jgi:hypothetical protein